MGAQATATRQGGVAGVRGPDTTVAHVVAGAGTAGMTEVTERDAEATRRGARLGIGAAGVDELVGARAGAWREGTNTAEGEAEAGSRVA